MMPITAGRRGNIQRPTSRRKSHISRDPNVMVKAVPMAHAIDETLLRWLVTELGPGSASSLELICADGQRMRLARGVNESALRTLIASAQADGSRIELVLPGSRRGAPREFGKEPVG